MVSSPQPYYNYTASVYPYASSSSSSAMTTMTQSANTSTNNTSVGTTSTTSPNGSPSGSPFAGGNLLQTLFGMIFGGKFPPSGGSGQGFPPFGGAGQPPFLPPLPPFNNQPLQKNDYLQALRFADNQLAYGELPTGTSDGTVTRQELTNALTRLTSTDPTPQRLRQATTRLLNNFTALDNRFDSRSNLHVSTTTSSTGQIVRFSPELDGLAVLDGQAGNISALDFQRLNQPVPASTPAPAPTPVPSPAPVFTTYADLAVHPFFTLFG